MNKRQENLQRLFHPKSMAFIGTYDIIQQGINNALELGFTGEIYAVHQTREEINGIPCFKTIRELPVSLDAAYIAVRAEKTVEVVNELRSLGTAGCICYAAGFSEIGETELQQQLVDAAGDMALVGPNCYGMINFLDRAPLWPDRHGGKQVNQGVALISQSGNLSLNLTLTDRSIPVAYAISIGNQAALEIADYVEALCQDDRVTAIGLHIEGLNNIESFMKAAQIAIEKQIPIVALKTGSSELGSKLTVSHTSSLAGSDEYYDALFKRLNISRVHSLSALLETLKLFSVTGKISGRKLGVLTCSGGESTIVADLSAAKNITLPNLEAEQIEEISAMLTKFEHVGNPLDYNTSIWGKEKELQQCFEAFMKGPFDATILVLDVLKSDTGNVDPWLASLKAFLKAHTSMKLPAMIISILPEGLPSYYRDQLVEHGITPLQGVTDAFTAIEKVMTYYERLNDLREKESIPTNLLLPTINVNTDNSYSLNEWEGKQTIASYGVHVPRGKIVSTLDDQTNITEDMNGPFVVKAVSREIVHKTDVGAVKLFLQNEAEVRDAIEQMSNQFTHLLSGEPAFLVEEMVQHDVAELNVGIKRDEQFGLALIISMGGELINLLNDSAVILLPTTREEISEALFSLKGIELLQGFRGRKRGDVEAVIDAAEAISILAEHYRDELLEMDVNPLLVLPEGEGAIAVDAYIRLGERVQYKHVL